MEDDHLSTLVLQVCKLQQSLQITDMTLKSKVKVTYTIRKTCLMLITQTPLTCFDQAFFIFDSHVEYNKYDLTVKGQGHVYLKLPYSS